MSILEKNRNHINKDIHYFCMMRPINTFMGMMSFTSSSDPMMWFECYIDEERYKVDDNYKITLRDINGRAYEHYYQDDFLQLMYEGLIVPKTSEDMHIEYVQFNEPIPNTCAYLHHEGQCIVGTFEPIKVGDKVRIRYFSFVTEVIAKNEEENTLTVQWTDDDGNTHTQTDSIEEYMKVV